MNKVKHKHNINDKVYAISEWYADGKPSGHYAIVKAIVESFNITVSEDETITNYWLTTPSGEQWGDCVNEKEVFETFEDACKWAREQWERLEDWK